MNQKMTQACRPEKNEDFFRRSNFGRLNNYKITMYKKIIFIGMFWLIIIAGREVFASSEKSLTEYISINEALKDGWNVNKGKAGKLQGAKLTIVKGAVAGESGLRVEVQHAGPWQGLALNKEIDFSQIAKIEFSIRQNVRTSGKPYCCTIQAFFKDGGYALANPEMGLGEKWKKISLDLRCPPWTIHYRKKFGLIKRLRFGPSRHLDTPGEYIEISGLRFIKKSEVAGWTEHGIKYEYVPDNNKTDIKRNLLLDGKISKENQVVFPPYGGDPVIVFDLGTTQTLTQVILKAIASPLDNIVSANIEISDDRKKWQSVGSIKNNLDSQKVTEYKIGTQCFGVGRFVRLTLKRSRMDQPLVLGEVVLERRVTIAKDRQTLKKKYFTGPVLPKIPENLVDNNEYAFLKGKEISVAIHLKTGVIAGIWNQGKLLVIREWDRYILENKSKKWESSAYKDQCQKKSSSGENIVFEGNNPDIPDTSFRKSYRIVKTPGTQERLEKCIEFINNGSRNDLFITVLSNLALAEKFRQGGYYEGVQVRNGRIGAADVYFERVIAPNRGVMLVHPDSGKGLTQYLYRLNEHFVYPWFAQNKYEAYNKTLFNSCGWEIGNATLKLAPQKPTSLEVHIAALTDGRFGWERHYVHLPEYIKDMRSIKRPGWSSEIKSVFVNSYNAVLWNMQERTQNRTAKIFDDGYCVYPALCFDDGAWGVLSTSGHTLDLFGGITPVSKLVEICRDSKKLPFNKIGLYMWLQSVTEGVPIYKKHPEWFITNNKNGDKLTIFPTLKTNFGRILDAPGHVEFLVNQVSEFFKKYPQDIWYLDGGNAAVNIIDWKTLRITQIYKGQDFVKEIRSNCLKINPEALMFHNESSSKVADIGFVEIGRHFGRDWRLCASRMYSLKVRQFFDQGRFVSPLYWVGGGNGYLRCCTALGMIPAFSNLSTISLLRYAPYCSAAFETRGVQFSPTHVLPDWRADELTDIEMYSLRAGNALVVPVISHKDKQHKQNIRIQIPEDLAKPGESLYLVCHKLKDVSKYHVPQSDFTAKRVYNKHGWALGTVTELESIVPVKVNGKGWVETELALAPEMLTLLSFVKYPVYYWSRNFQRANFLLPSVRKHHLDCGMNGNSLDFVATQEEKPGELISLAPQGLKVDKIEINGKTVSFNEFKLKKFNAATFSLPQSSSPVKGSISFVSAAAERKGKLTLSVPVVVQAGKSIAVKVSGASGPISGSLWRSGTLIKIFPSQEATKLDLTIPKEAHNGNYLLSLSDKYGRNGETEFTVKGHRQVDRIPPLFPPMQPQISIEQAASGNYNLPNGISILSTGKAHYAGGTPKIDLKNLTLTAEMPDQTFTYTGYSFAGMELRGLKKAAVKITHNMFPAPGIYPDRNVLAVNSANAFIGFIVDYGSAKGYKYRVAISAGRMSIKRNSLNPVWGTKRKPDCFLAMPPILYTGTKLEGVLDFSKWAPADWDGRLWITVAMDRTLRSRWLSLQLLSLNPNDGQPLIPVTKLSGKMVGNLRIIKAVKTNLSLQIDGNPSDVAWNNAEKTSGTSLIGINPIRSSQETQIHASYDQHFLYLLFTCKEKEKKGFSSNNGAVGKPWFDDSIEFSLWPSSWKDKYLHVIISSGGMSNKGIYYYKKKVRKNTNIKIMTKVLKKSGVFIVEAAIPLGKNGLPEPETGKDWRVQFMRTRVSPDGAHEFTTWSPSDKYHNIKCFGVMKIK